MKKKTFQLFGPSLVLQGPQLQPSHLISLHCACSNHLK